MRPVAVAALEVKKMGIAMQKLPDQIEIIWHLSDVIDRAASAHDIELSNDDARRILHNVSKHRESTGVSWDSLDYWITDYAAGR